MGERISDVLRRINVRTVALVAVTIVAVGGGTAVAAKLITGADVKNNSLTGKDIRNGSVGSRDLTNDSVKGKDVKDESLTGDDIQDESLTGDDIQDGSVGSGDLEAGTVPDSQELVADRLTPENSAFGGLNVVAVPAEARTSSGPTSSSGAELFDPVALDEGQYKIEGTIQFFDFTQDAEGIEYGVAKVFVEDDDVATLWSPDVPDDGNNSGQTSGTALLDIPAGGATLSVRAVMRTDETDGGQAGGNLIVTSIPDTP